MEAIVRTRRLTAIALIAFVVALGIAFAVTLGPLALFLYAITMPVPVFMLWMATDVTRADELRDLSTRTDEQRVSQLEPAQARR